MDLHDVIHRLVDKRGPSSEDEAQVFHDAVEAHASGLEDSEDVRKRREAQADATLAGEFEGVSDAELTDRAADGDVRAQQERQRRKAMAPAAKSSAKKTEPEPEPATA